MIEQYANQSMILRTPGSPNAYGELSYTDSTITGRFTGGGGAVKNIDGRDIIYDGLLSTETAIPEEGLVVYGGDTYAVQHVQTIRYLDGTVAHYKVMLGRVGSR